MKKLETAILLLKEIEQHNQEAYIVGGFVRDLLRKKPNDDIDICTSMTPNMLKKYFKVLKENYGSSLVIYHDEIFEITTFRKEVGNILHRHPQKVHYIKSLQEDLQRRDFKINAICMNSKREIIDPLNGQNDIINRRIVCIGDAKKRFEEDSFRILRAIRFATTLNFTMDEKLKEAIIEKKHLLKNISYQRKKEELDKIFYSKNASYGRKLLIDLDLSNILEIPKLKDAILYSHPLLIWMQLDVDALYPFSKKEKKQMNYLRKCQKETFQIYRIYESDFNTCILIGMLKGIEKEEIKIMKKNLPIHSREDINITSQVLAKYIPNKKLSQCYKQIEKEILRGYLKNNVKEIKKWVESNHNFYT